MMTNEQHLTYDSGPTPHPSARCGVQHVFLAVATAAVFVADLASNRRTGPRLAIRPVAADVDFLLAKKRGGAWSMFRDFDEHVRRPFFPLISAVAKAIVIHTNRRLRDHRCATRWGLVLVLGAALGNLFDRVHPGKVPDFVLLHVVCGGHHYQWLSFNADIGIVVGVALIALEISTRRKNLGLLDASSDARAGLG
jgi:signal peptidase II